MKVDKVLSTNRQNWRTPKWLITTCEGLIGGKFNIDLAATKENTICENFVTDFFDLETFLEPIRNIDENEEMRFFLNPPFSRKTDFILHLLEYLNHGLVEPRGVIILPTVYSTEFWQNLNLSGYVHLAIDIVGRVGFIDPETLAERKDNTFGTTLVFIGEKDEVKYHERRILHRDTLKKFAVDLESKAELKGSLVSDAGISDLSN